MKPIVRITSALGATLAFGALLAGTAAADDENYQLGTNEASSMQEVAAVSGYAWATNSSIATSGNSDAAAFSAQYQAIFQETAALYNEQDAWNGAQSGQGIAAASGDADADSSSDSWTGNASGLLDSYQEQIQEQRGRSR